MRYWGIFRLCGECGEPAKFIDVCEELGFNPGVDGHFYKTADDAYRALDLLMTNSKNHYTNFWDDTVVTQFTVDM